MNVWLQRWYNLAPREQWLAYGVGLVLLTMLFFLIVSDPLSTRIASRENAVKLAEARQLEAHTAVAEIEAKKAADPNAPYNTAILAAEASGEQLISQIDRTTHELIPPEQMRGVLEDLLKSQKGLHLIGMESFSEPVKLPALAQAAVTPAQPGEVAKAAAPISEVTLYRHGMRLSLQGGYFDLLTYLQAIQGTGWKLNWDALDYKVGDGGPGQASINLTLYTLSRQAGWVGV